MSSIVNPGLGVSAALTAGYVPYAAGPSTLANSAMVYTAGSGFATVINSASGSGILNHVSNTSTATASLAYFQASADNYTVKTAFGSDGLATFIAAAGGWMGTLTNHSLYLITNNTARAVLSSSSLTLSSGISIYNASTLNINSGVTVALNSLAADGATAVAAEVNTLNAWVNTAARLQSWKTNSVEKAYITAAGNLSLAGYCDLTAIATPATPGASIVRMYSLDFSGHYFPTYKDNDGLEIVLSRDTLMIVRNTTGSTITKGQVVYVNGTTGVVPTVALAQADSTMTKLPAVAIAHQNILNNAYGHVLVQGLLSSFDTSAFSAGATVYLSAATPGALTATAPTHPSVEQAIGVVTASGVGNGSIWLTLTPLNLHLIDGVNGATFAIGNATGTTKSYLVKNALGTGTLSWNPTTDRTLTLPDTTGTLATTTDLGAYLPLAGGTMVGAITFSGTQLGTYTLGGTPTLGVSTQVVDGIDIGDATHRVDLFALTITSGATSLTLTSGVANSGTNVGLIVNNSVALSGTTLLASFRNNGTEKVNIQDDGSIGLGSNGVATFGGASSALLRIYTIDVTAPTATDLFFTGDVANSGTNSALHFNNSTSLSGTTNLAIFTNAGSAKAYIYNDGSYIGPKIGTSSSTLHAPPAGTGNLVAVGASGITTDGDDIGDATHRVDLFALTVNAGATSLNLAGWSAADGATAVGVILNSTTALANAAAKPLSIRNGNVEQMYVDKYGDLVFAIAGAGIFEPTYAAGITLFSNRMALYGGSSALVQPVTDNAISFGGASLRWTGVYTLAVDSGATSLSLTSGVANSGTNVGLIFNNSVALTGTTLLASFRNNGVEKFAIADDGSLALQGTTTGTYSLGGTPTLASDLTLSAGVDIIGSTTSNFKGNVFLSDPSAAITGSLGAGNGSGGSPSITIGTGSNNHGGLITVVTGSGSIVAGDWFTITMPYTAANGWAVSLFPNNDDARLFWNEFNYNNGKKITYTATTWTLNLLATNLPTSTTFVFTYTSVPF